MIGGGSRRSAVSFLPCCRSCDGDKTRAAGRVQPTLLSDIFFCIGHNKPGGKKQEEGTRATHGRALPPTTLSSAAARLRPLLPSLHALLTAWRALPRGQLQLEDATPPSACERAAMSTPHPRRAFRRPRRRSGGCAAAVG